MQSGIARVSPSRTNPPGQLPCRFSFLAFRPETHATHPVPLAGFKTPSPLFYGRIAESARLWDENAYLPNTKAARSKIPHARLSFFLPAAAMYNAGRNWQ